MIKNATLNLNAIEAMHFFWTSVASREKVNENFIVDVSNLDPLKLIFDTEFTQESVRRSLSALSNREPFSGNKIESRFYSRNLMTLEYIDGLDDKINAFKAIRLNEIIQRINTSVPDLDLEHLDVIITPSPFEATYCRDNKIILNFFKFHLVDGQLKAEDMNIDELLIAAIK